MQTDSLKQRLAKLEAVVAQKPSLEAQADAWFAAQPPSPMQPELRAAQLEAILKQIDDRHFGRSHAESPPDNRPFMRVVRARLDAQIAKIVATLPPGAEEEAQMFWQARWAAQQAADPAIVAREVSDDV